MIAGSGNGHMFALHRELKNALYLCARIDPVGFLENLAAFGFPKRASGRGAVLSANS